jgi:hypothetical protein
MNYVAYRVAARFSAESGEAWTKFIKWSGLGHLTEIVGLDTMLRPSVFGELVGEDWDHLMFGETIGDCFDDLEFLLRRMSGRFDAGHHQVLALLREPLDHDVQHAVLPGFRFMGFELVEEETSTSALTNCGGFEGAFEGSDLSQAGLVASASQAYRIRDALAKRFPDEPHAQCAVWALWRRERT